MTNGLTSYMNISNISQKLLVEPAHQTRENEPQSK